MWIIVQQDTEEDYVNVLMDDQGETVKFKDKISAWRWMERMCKEFNIDYQLMENDVELWRLH
mgnify:FL=1